MAISTTIPSRPSTGSTGSGVVRYYVDSINGLDGNNGTSPSTPFQTIAQLATKLASNIEIYLARGSYWRESLDISSYTNISIDAYGSGSLPQLDCADVAANVGFSKTSGRTNVYQTNFTPLHGSGVSGGDNLSVWENGARLTRASSVADCDSTPGSFYADLPVASTQQIVYIYPVGGGNPTTNGRLYEFTKRGQALIVGNYNHISNCHTSRNGSNNGSTEAGYGCLIEDCFFEDGTKHNMLIKSGIVRNCIAWKSEVGVNAQQSILFVAYDADPSALEVLFENCVAIGGDGDALTSNGSVSSGYYAHGSPNTYKRVTAIGCSAENCYSWGSLPATDEVIINRCNAKRCDNGIAALAATNIYVEGCEVYIKSSSTGSALSFQAAGTIHVKGNKIGYSNSSAKGLVFDGTAVLDCSENTIAASAGGGYGIWFKSGTLTGSVTRTAIIGADFAIQAAVSIASLTIDYNVYPLNGRFFANSTSYSSLSTYQAGTSKDANSVASGLVLSGNAFGEDFVTDSSSPLYTKAAGAGYWTQHKSRLAALGEFKSAALAKPGLVFDGVKRAASSTNQAIVTWSGTTGTQVSDNSPHTINGNNFFANGLRINGGDANNTIYQSGQIRLTSDTSVGIGVGNTTTRLLVNATNITASLPWVSASYTVGTLPSASASARGNIYVSDAAGGPIPCFSDGSNWKRVDTAAVVT